MHRIDDLLDIMARLRTPGSGCPWDLRQTFDTIAPYTLEEAYEVADAIARRDMPELCDELGDLLFQVAFHARMAQEQGGFAFADVVDAICSKMIRRHPHVFADAGYASEDELHAAWEGHKRAERAARSSADPGLLDGVALALPALSRAEKLQRRAARIGFDWQDVGGVLAKVQEELAEIHEARAAGSDPAAVADEVGDLLFSCVNLARHLGVDAEQALRGANRKFERRFRAMEVRLAARGRAVGEAAPAELDAAWEDVKATEDAERSAGA
ncbi:MAG: nucleoside triphosphate pyrophosphohydrolase [Gammaproteobacteria bacterium]|jgi:MazG family protein|nr:nucleoside triphosphate pyrophosphohydrolase [Gammaproteobacteria bacterium]